MWGIPPLVPFHEDPLRVLYLLLQLISMSVFTILRFIALLILINKWSYDILRESMHLCHTLCITRTDTHAGLILSLHPTNERRRYTVTPYLIGWAQAYNVSLTTAVYYCIIYPV